MNAIFANLRKTEMAINMEFKVEILNANQQINQLQRNSFQWYHEESLPMQVVNAVQPLRPQVLIDLKACVSALATTQKVRHLYQYFNLDVCPSALVSASRTPLEFDCVDSFIGPIGILFLFLDEKKFLAWSLRS